jgi:transglutaminase-like putative cysteine protease
MLRPKAAIIAIALLTPACFSQDTAPKQRHFVLRYSVNVKDVPAGKEFRVWIPLAHTDAFQDVQVLSKQGDAKLRKSVEDAYGNTAFYAEAEPERTRDYRFTIEYDVVRTERIDITGGKLASGAHPERASEAVLAMYLQPDRLVPVTGPVAQSTAEDTKSATTPLEKARAIYGSLTHNFRFNPSGSGCCRGDVNRTLASKQGDSLDLASVFVAMARSQQIPARSVIGFQLPVDQHSAEIRKASAWAEYYAVPLGWLPADPATAIRNPILLEYAFGSLDTDRLQFTVGRDLKLNPPQEGPPVNFFIDPYVEVEGKAYSRVSLDVSFHDVGASAGADHPH